MCPVQCHCCELWARVAPRKRFISYAAPACLHDHLVKMDELGTDDSSSGGSADDDSTANNGSPDDADDADAADEIMSYQDDEDSFSE